MQSSVGLPGQAALPRSHPGEAFLLPAVLACWVQNLWVPVQSEDAPCAKRQEESFFLSSEVSICQDGFIRHFTCGMGADLP